MRKVYPVEIRVRLPDWMVALAEFINIGYKMIGPILTGVLITNFHPLWMILLLFWVIINFEVEVKEQW